MLKQIIIITFSVLVFFTGCTKEDEQQNIPKVQTKIVKTTTLNTKNNLTNWYEYPAEIYPYHNVNMAFELSGKIVKFNYKAGERVKKGAIIAKLDDTIFNSNLKAAEANYNQAMTDYTRYKKLYTSKVIAKNEYERAKQNLDVQKAKYDIAKKNLEDTKLIAEFDGIVAKKTIDDFARVSAKQTILILQDNSKYKVKFSVPERDILNTMKKKTLQEIANSANILVTLGDENREYKAQFIDISTLAQSVTRTYEVTALIDNPKDKNVLPGMTAKVKTSIRDDKANTNIFIPYQAVFSDASKNSYVWSVTKDKKVIKTPIKTGRLVDSFVLVTSGLQGDEQIVTSGVHQLQSGDTIKLYKKLGK